MLRPATGHGSDDSTVEVTTGSDGIAAVNFLSDTQTGSATVTASASGAVAPVEFTAYVVAVPEGWAGGSGGGSGGSGGSTLSPQPPPPRRFATQSLTEMSQALADGYRIRVQDKLNTESFPQFDPYVYYLGDKHTNVVGGYGGYGFEHGWATHARLTFDPPALSIPHLTPWGQGARPAPRVYLVRLYEGLYVDEVNEPDHNWEPKHTALLTFSYSDTGVRQITLSGVGGSIPSSFIRVDGNTVVMTPAPPASADKRFRMKIDLLPTGFERDEDVEDINWQTMTGQLAKALPGQRINIRPKPISGMIMTDFHWELPQKTFKEYAADQSTGKLIPMLEPDKSYGSCSFYFADSGSKTIKVTLKIDGINVTLYTTMFIATPPIGNISLKRASTANQFPIPNTTPGVVKLALMPSDVSHDGMEFDGTASTLPEWPKGKIAWVQLVTPYRVRVTSLGTYTGSTKNNKLCLDTTYPYAHPGDPINVDDDQVHHFTDSPSDILLPTDSSYTVFDRFTLFLMYKADGIESQYVPLKSIDWSWTCHSVFNPTTSTWLVPPNPPHIGSQRDATDHPTWEQNVRDTP